MYRGSVYKPVYKKKSSSTKEYILQIVNLQDQKINNDLYKRERIGSDVLIEFVN